METARCERAEQFHEVDYRAFVTGPMDIVRAIYARFDLDLDPGAAAAMERWVAENPQGKHGEHRYTPEQFGLTADDIREQFAGYIERCALG
jgi:hypothetical protein